MTIDNRAAEAERLVLKLEELGYRFRISRTPDGREVYLFQATPDAIASIESSRLLQELQLVKGEVIEYMNNRAKKNLSIVKGRLSNGEAMSITRD